MKRKLPKTPSIIKFMKSVDKEAFGRRIAQRRDELGISRGELAAIVGMSQGGIASIESGLVARPRLLHELAAALSTTGESLLHGEDAEKAVVGRDLAFAGSVLRELREKNGMTQAVLAALAKTSPPQIARLEKGQRKLTKQWAERLAPHLGVSAVDLMFPEKTGPELYPTALGRRIAERRNELGMSQEKLGVIVGMRQQGIAAIEAGKVARPRLFLELATALNMTPEWLLHGSGAKEAGGASDAAAPFIETIAVEASDSASPGIRRIAGLSRQHLLSLAEEAIRFASAVRLVKPPVSPNEAKAWAEYVLESFEARLGE